ncbi:hypothetical protein GOP47_0028369 [Adiantum capillus-veneris]|nr:hypothetical protein GOP47_0028369 [Adiantum capillus-veneris]
MRIIHERAALVPLLANSGFQEEQRQLAHFIDKGSTSRLPTEKAYSLLDDKQSNATWNRKTHQTRVGSAPECNMDDDLLKEKNTTNLSGWVGAEKHMILQEGPGRVLVGSLPDCMSSDFLVERFSKKSDCRQSHARSLTDQDFTELKGCIDLGFVFPSDHVPDLRETLPALEVCYAVAHGAISPVGNMEDSKPLSPSSPPISPWRIASPGDQPQQVKARLRHWAQAVACNVRQP